MIPAAFQSIPPGAPIRLTERLCSPTSWFPPPLFVLLLFDCLTHCALHVENSFEYSLRDSQCLHWHSSANTRSLYRSFVGGTLCSPHRLHADSSKSATVSDPGSCGAMTMAKVSGRALALALLVASLVCVEGGKCDDGSNELACCDETWLWSLFSKVTHHRFFSLRHPFQSVFSSSTWPTEQCHLWKRSLGRYSECFTIQLKANAVQ